MLGTLIMILTVRNKETDDVGDQHILFTLQNIFNIYIYNDVFVLNFILVKHGKYI